VKEAVTGLDLIIYNGMGVIIERDIIYGDSTITEGDHQPDTITET
jgi:hypothetical protein